MKRLTALLLCFVLLQSGCSDKTPSEPVASEQEMQQTIRHTTPTTVTTSAATTTVTTVTLPEESAEQIAEETAETLPEGYDYIIPEHSELQVETKYIAGSKLDLLNIMDRIGYELESIDLESDENYTERRSFIEEHYSGEELNGYRSRNYFESIYPTAYYIGSDTTDWVVITEYNAGSQISPYARIVCIKDNELAYTSEVLDLPSMWFLSDGMLFSPAGENGLCIFDVEERHIRYINSAADGTPLAVAWYGIIGYSDDYIVFECYDPENYHYTATYMLYKRSDEVRRTSLVSFDPYCDSYRISENRLYYHIDYLNESGIYDLSENKAELLAPNERSHLCCMEDDNYLIRSLYENERGQINMKAVSITRKSDGKEKFFDLREKVCEPKGSMTYSENLHFFDSDGDWLYIVIQGNDFALNFETEQTADITGDTSLTRTKHYDNGHYRERISELSDDRMECTAFYVQAVEVIPPPHTAE